LNKQKEKELELLKDKYEKILEEMKRKSKYRKVTMDAMDTMITSHRLQVIAKQMAEKAWAPMMAQIYIKDAMLSVQPIQQIVSDVSETTRAAISIIPALSVKKADIFQKYEKDVKDILRKINSHLTQSLRNPSRSKEFTDIAKHELQKAQSIKSKAVERLGTMNERFHERGRTPVSKSSTRSRDRSRASKSPVRYRGRSPARYTVRSMNRKDKSPVPPVIGQ
jgi:hypothetical protein